MKTRILSGIVLAIIMISSSFYGGLYLYLLCLGVSLIGMYELYKVINMQKSPMAFVGYLGAILYYLCIITGYEKYDIFVFVVVLMAIMSVYVFTFPKYTIEQVTLMFLGLFYVAVMLSYIYKVRILEDGIYIVWLVFIASWGNDTCAYFTGVFLGKHKMAPILSPKKSIEGAIGGIAGSTLLGAILGYIVSGRITENFIHPVLIFAIASFVGAILAIIGDLTASAIKRNHNIKDYGKLIPGHGGILDRYDSVIFTAPVVFWAVFILNRL